MFGKVKATLPRCRPWLLAAAGLWLGAVSLHGERHHPAESPEPTPDTPLAAAAARAGIDQPTPPPTPIPVAPTPPPEIPPPQAPARSEVFAIRDPFAISEYHPDDRRVREMVNRLVLAVTERENVAEGWRSLVEPKDVVGIKIAATGGPSGSTHRAVVETIIEGLRSAGVPTGNIIVWDRDTEGLIAAGYLDRAGRSTLPCAVVGIAARGYDPQDTYTAPVLGRLIWGDLLFRGAAVPADGLHTDAGQIVSDPLSSRAPALGGGNNKLSDSLIKENLSNVSHYSNILAHRVTKIISVPVFADSLYAGIGGALYNVTIPNVDNWRRFVAPPRYGITAIPEMFSDPQLGGKVVLSFTDALVAQIAGGPYFQPLYARQFATIYASRDAVALDAVVLRQLEGWRVQAQLPSLKDIAGHVKMAGDMGLGNAAPEKIDLRTLTR